MTTRVDGYPITQTHVHEPEDSPTSVFATQVYEIAVQLDRDASTENIEQARAWLTQARGYVEHTHGQELALRDQIDRVEISLQEAVQTQQIQEKAETIVNQPEFRSLEPSIQTARRAELNRVIDSPSFRNLDPRLQDAVIETIASGRGNAAEVMRAATMQFHEGIRTNARTEADRQEFTILVQRAMVNSPSFREQMFTQNEDAAHPITMGVGHSQRTVEIDISGAYIYGLRPSTHRVDLDDIAQLPAVPDRSRSAHTTQDQTVIHFMTEATVEAHARYESGGLELVTGSQSTTSVSAELQEYYREKPLFELGHREGIRAENRYREELGLEGRVVRKDGIDIQNGSFTVSRDNMIDAVRILYDNGDAEIRHLNRQANIHRIQYRRGS